MILKEVFIMGLAEEIIKQLQSLEGKKIIESFLLELVRKNEKAKDMVSNLDYINWMKKFSSQYPTTIYNDEIWFSGITKVSEQDKEKIRQLSYFYRGIKNWASQNLIYPEEIYENAHFGYYYNIQLNGEGFQVGILHGQGSICYYEKVAVVNKENFIDFQDILIDKHIDRLDEYNNYIDLLYAFIHTLYNCGISLQDIAVVAQDTIVSFNGQEKCASIPLIPEVDTSLNSLRNLILSGYHNGVPVRAIFNVICNAVEKLQVNEECKFEEQSRSI